MTNQSKLLQGTTSGSSPSVLVVGAGAVGLVYGRHLVKGGANVTYYIREKYRAQAAAGYPMYPLNTQKRDKPVLFADFSIVTSARSVADAGPFDQVWLCVSSPALRGDWLADILRGAGDDATVVLLTNGMGDHDMIAGMSSVSRVVQGMISMISYQGPLPGESLPEPGCVYWFPPLGPSPFSGDKARVDAIVSTLKRGGCPASTHPDVGGQVGFPTAVLMPFLLALEGAGWKFDAVKRGDWLNKAVAAAKEAMATVSASGGQRPPMPLRLLSPMVLRAALALAPSVIPLDVEAFLAYHFTKVGDQTRMYVQDYIAVAQDKQLPADHLRQLCALLPAPETPMRLT